MTHSPQQQTAADPAQTLDCAPVMVWAGAGPGGFANRALQEFTGTPDWIRNLHDDDRRARSTALAENESLQATWRLQRRDGVWRRVEERVVAGKQGRIGCLVDVTQHLEAEDRLRWDNEQLRAAERARTVLLNAAAHELRNPLVILLMQLQLTLRMEHLEEPLRERLHVALRNAERLQSQLTELVNVGIKNTRSFDISPSPVDLREVLQEAIASFDVPAQVKGISIELKEASPVLAMGDRRRLVQVAGNLLGNAVKFTPRGGRVTLAAWQEGREACFSVSDTGPGIPPAQHENLFKPFQQLHHASVDGGTGLGLFICRNIVAAHRGQITASQGEGASFTVRLPAK